ncbi:MAG TPA: N-acetylmuramoyl-L-alanine amidase [Gemmatimonadaceae bacterium]
MIALALVALQVAAAASVRAPAMHERVSSVAPLVVTHDPIRLLGAAQRTVVVDAGHGGVDNGMSGPIGGAHKIYEKNITLQVAMKLGAALTARGVNVVYTRTTDTLINLYDRGPIANRAHGDLFISVHVNASNPKWKDAASARGYETYFLSEAKTEDARRVEAMENASARFDTGTDVSKGDPLSFILSDMQQNEHLRESMKLADAVQDELGSVEPGPNRGVQQAAFVVLETAFMPAVLVEIGFGTNPQEAAFISDARSQTRIANSIADAAVEYLNAYWSGVNGMADRAGGGSR